MTPDGMTADGMTPDGMTPEERIIALIRDEGPIGVDHYMRLCLVAYYARGAVFGARGDFITAPDISQVFGELIGLWAAHCWQAMGEPARLRLIELGPGRGALMADALRAAKVLPGFHAAIELHLVETSSALRAMQARALDSAAIAPRWHESLDAALGGSAAPSLLIANEFLDALPIRQFQRRDGAWRERLVGLNGEGRLCFGLHPEPARLSDAPDAPEGAVMERAAEAESVVALTARHIAAHGGAALFIDYGADHAGMTDTLQAVKRHRFVDVFETPGEADLTAQVDFARMARVAKAAGAAAQPLATQGDFLNALGIGARISRLCANATPDHAAAIIAAADRLTDISSPTAMGALFKALCLRHQGLPPLPGFAP
jgi:SAM-dependent MidA family methyltransferase